MRLVNGSAWLELDPVGAIVRDAALTAGRSVVKPFFDNPWHRDPREMDTLTRHLGAEWPCVPFGVPQPPANLPKEWQSPQNGPGWNGFAHGYGAHSTWSLTQINARSAMAEIAYPETTPIVGLRRHIELVAQNEIRFRLEVDARFDSEVPLGIHPVVSLAGSEPGTAKLDIAGEETAWTFPVDVEPGMSFLAPDQRRVPISTLRTSAGGQVDARHLPFPGQSEDLVLLSAPGGCVSLSRPDLGYCVDIRWNDADLPFCLLWLSNRGRDYAPWDSRVCAIGIEPVAAAFDLGVPISTSRSTPLARDGLQSFVRLVGGTTWQTEYSIRVRAT